MSDLTVTKTRVQEGVWEGVVSVLEGGAPVPDIEVTHLEKALDGVELKDFADGTGNWLLRFPVPASILAEGVQTLLITDKRSGETLDRLTIVTGEPLEDDLRAEIDLLRAELDMLKRAFRRHCVETM
ncbi:MAG: hypothetical protein ACWA47_04695 [Brevirhabdus sp.]